MKLPGALLLVSLLASPLWGQKWTDAQKLVKDSFEYYRGKASVSVATMTVHRPDWERTSKIKGWTRGERETLLTTLAPARDRGNGTLKVGSSMWTYNPKVKRIIKLPPSVMSQSWMGSDFSNNDLAKSDTIIEDYTHKFVSKPGAGGKLYVIDSIPKPNAPVVWGKVRLFVRPDLIYEKQEFYDEDGKLVKTLTFSRVKSIGSKLYATEMTMSPKDKKGHYTRVVYDSLKFVSSLPNNYFTKAALRNPPEN